MSKKLINPKGDINKQGKDGQTPLHRNVIQGKRRQVTALLQGGAVVSMQDGGGDDGFGGGEVAECEEDEG